MPQSLACEGCFQVCSKQPGLLKVKPTGSPAAGMLGVWLSKRVSSRRVHGEGNTYQARVLGRHSQDCSNDNRKGKRTSPKASQDGRKIEPRWWESSPALPCPALLTDAQRAWEGDRESLGWQASVGAEDGLLLSYSCRRGFYLLPVSQLGWKRELGTSREAS